MQETSSISAMVPLVAGCVTLLFGSGLAFLLMQKKKAEQARHDAEEAAEELEVLDTEKFPGGYLTIYYGSQTGTAEQFGNDIKRDGEENGFKVKVVDLEEIEDSIKEHLLKEHRRDENGKSRALFLMSTYGEGEPTDNAASFAQFLKEGRRYFKNQVISTDNEEKKGEDDENANNEYSLASLEYAVFGLGNRQYEHFNAMGKLVDECVGKLGAERIMPLSEGDDDDDLEGDFETWKDKKLWPALKKKYVGDAFTGGKGGKLPTSRFAVEYLTSAAPADSISLDDVQNSTKHYFTSVDCAITRKRELRSPNDEGSTLHVEIDISDAKEEVKYQTADNLGILPVNSNEDVQRLANALGYELGTYFRLLPAADQKGKFAAPFPTPCTVHECLSRYCDIIGSPRRSDLKLLAAFAKDQTTKKALLRMASKEGKAEYNEKIVEAKVGMVDIISKLCPSIEIPLEHFISLCPRLQPRHYTISSSSSVHPTSVHVTVSVLKSTRDDGTEFKGVCSNHLAETNESGKVRVFSRDSTFRLPADASKPIIMIGPGTGIAPMRALLQERAHQKKKQKLKVGENVLYFGCKKRELDFIYADELEAFKKAKTLTKMHLAFSREQEEKVYVQHLLAKNAKETWKLMEKGGAYIYVCGGVRMGQDVSEALRKIVSSQGDLTTTDAKKYLEQMSSSGRYVQELWA